MNPIDPKSRKAILLSRRSTMLPGWGSPWKSTVVEALPDLGAKQGPSFRSQQLRGVLGSSAGRQKVQLGRSELQAHNRFLERILPREHSRQARRRRDIEQSGKGWAPKVRIDQQHRNLVPKSQRTRDIRRCHTLAIAQLRTGDRNDVQRVWMLQDLGPNDPVLFGCPQVPTVKRK